jgi:hypothetical protein
VSHFAQYFDRESASLLLQEPLASPFDSDRQPVRSGAFMPPTVQVGSILIEGFPQMTQLRDLESEPYSGNWRLPKALSFAFDRSIRTAGWHFFFMAAEIKVNFFGAPGAKKIENAVQRILAKLKPQYFNSLEITGIVAKRFLGLPYATVSAHPRHLQESCYLDGPEKRRTSQRDGK